MSHNKNFFFFVSHIWLTALIIAHNTDKTVQKS